MDSTADNDYFELEPYDQYKPQEAKFQASLKWLFGKAYNNSIPSELDEPFFEENELGKSLRNELVRELISGQVYCAAAKNIFNNPALNTSHQKYLYFSTVSEIFEQLINSSVSITDENDDPVNAQVIAQDSPFYVSAHLALIDSLMTAYSTRVMKIDTTINTVKKYTAFNPSADMPTNLETTCVLWLNKVSTTVLDLIQNECELYAKQSGGVGCQSHMHLLQIRDNLSASLANGTILAVLLVFYTCDMDIDLSDIALQEAVGFEESVENLNLVKEFCEKHLTTRPFCFNFEDFLYSPTAMKTNKLAFIAELFYLLEVQPASKVVQSNHFEQFKEYIKKFTKRQYHATTPFLSARIGDVTRNSFIKGSYTPPSRIQSSDNKPESTSTKNNQDEGKIEENSLNNTKKQIFAINIDKNNLDKSNNKPVVSVIKSNGTFTNEKFRNSTTSNYFKKMSTTTNGSFNSLLDNVLLDQSQNFEDVSSSSIVKSSNDSDKVKIRDEAGSVKSDSDFEYHPMFTSRTYVKDTPQVNRPSLSQSNENSKQQQLPELPKAHPYKSPEVNLTKTSTRSDQSSIDIGMKTIRMSQNNNNSNNDQSIPTQQSLNQSHNKSPAKQDSPQKSQTVSAPSDGKVADPVASSTSGTGLVRRLSVTARPGDIFYKVKDVTESSSSTDTNESPNSSVTKVSSTEETINPSKSYTISTNNTEEPSSAPVVQQQAPPVVQPPQPPQQPQQQQGLTSFGTMGRKTTSWNVKRNQTSGVETTSATEASPSQVVSQPATTAEPGSPMFNKELLNIRMQLKEKKSSMERDKRKLESELERQRATIGKQVFLQVVGNSNNNTNNATVNTNTITKDPKMMDLKQKISAMTIPKFSPKQPQEPPTVLQAESPKPALSEPTTTTADLKDSTPHRRQWDKSQKSFIDLENDNRQQTAQPAIADLSKACSSRDEMIRTIEVLKSTTIALANKAATVATEQSRQSGSDSAVKDIDTELQKANSKLAELQNEIQRLSLLQQQQQQITTTNKSLIVNAQPIELVDDEYEVDNSDSTDELNEPSPEEQEQSAPAEVAAAAPVEEAFFISFDNGTAKREKPPALTPKKNLFVKTDASQQDKDEYPQVSKHLLMTAVANGKQTMTKSKSDLVKKIEIDDEDSDGDLKQRKKEMIIQKQMERRQQQEMVRQQREEERARKAEEIRQKEEEANNKKQLEKTRKETIYAAYIDKKKQLQDEGQSAYHFGGSKIAQSNLQNAKKYHSTYRLKASASNYNNSQQNNFDDQASVISDRSSNVRYNNSNGNGQQTNGTMMKTYSTNNLYQGHSNSNNNNNNNNTATKKRTPASRNVRPPSCARPTISSLRKMNRTFSLNNVSAVGLSPVQKSLLEANTQQLGPQVLPLTRASLAAAEKQQQQESIETESMMRMTLLNNTSKLGSKYASSTFLNDYGNSSNMPTKTRTTPRRRTPRNAEEFLHAAGVPDPESYLTKGYYVGSMLNLSELAKSTPQAETSNHQQANFMSQQYNQAAPVSSSSSSSTNGGFNHNQLNVKHSHDDSQLSNNLQRRTSIHEATSISMANLNFLNSNFNSKSQQSPGFNCRQKNTYGKQRSATTAIIDTDFAEHQHETTTTGSSAPSSDSSSSPNPMLARTGPKAASGLGPLMSAVTKLESDNIMLNSPRTGAPGALNGFIEHRFFNSTQAPEDQEDDFDEYEYLEKNFGAEPPFASNALLNQRRTLENGHNLLENTTTNTNVTDYYTDESNSCNNDNEYPHQFNSSKTLCNNEETLPHQGRIHHPAQQKQQLNGQYLNNNSSNNINGNSNHHLQLNTNNFHMNGNASTTQLNKMTKPSPRPGWDQASVVSNNSAFSANEGINNQTLLNTSSYSSASSQQLKSGQSNSNKSEEVDSSEALRIINNEHFKFTSNALLRGSQADTSSTKIEHLLKTNAALSLMSKINLASSIKNNNKRLSLMLTSDDASTLDMSSESRSKSYACKRAQRPSSVYMPDKVELQQSSNANSNFIKRSFAPPSNAFSSLLKSASRQQEQQKLISTPRSTSVPAGQRNSQTAFDLNSMNSLSSSDSESASSQGLFFVKLENNDSFNSQRTMTKKSLDLPTSHSMHTFSLPHHGKQKVKSSGSFRHPVEYSGPKLFKRLTGKSNKAAILNSLNHRVLAGVVNANVRKQVIDEIEASDERHFIVLFRDYHLQYRAIYSYTSETDYIEKIVGTGPQKISEDMVETYFKYNSGARQFSQVPTKHFSVQCDGVSIHSVYWNNRKASNNMTNVAQIGAMHNGSQSAISSNYGTSRR